ncbi:MAG: YHS domain-containing (seleno)protein, partial [Pseudomonadota bacterium]
MINRRLFLLFSASVVSVAGAGLITARSARAGQVNWNKGNGGFAADGADVVAYFSLDAEARGVPGTDAYVTEWDGARWRFSSAENLAAFEASPEQYAPKYGGYCAWAVAQGYTAHGDINAWHVEDGQLYLNYNNRIRRRWRRDI